MTVPTFVRCLPAGTSVGTPAEGPTGGRSLVEIYGGGFRLPPTVPAGPSASPVDGVVYAEVPQTVSVTFGGTEALGVEVVRSNLLRVLTPIHDPGIVDVVITNLDDSGNAIAGETVTASQAYTFRLVKLDVTTESDFTRIIRNLILEWQRQVMPNVILTQSTDWDPDVTTAFVDVATLPAIVLSGPRVVENRFYSRNDLEETVVNGVVQVLRHVRTVDLNFDVIGISNNAIECLNMMALATEFMNRNPFFEMDRDPDDSTLGSVSYEFAMSQDFQTASRPNDSNVKYFTGAVLIRGFDVEGFAGIPSDQIRDLTVPLSSDISLDTSKL